MGEASEGLVELLAGGSGGAVGCREPRANSRTAEPRDLPTLRRRSSPSRMTSAAPAKKPYRKAPPEHRELRPEGPGSKLEQEEPLTDAERMKLLQQENEELRRRLASATRRTEALERELEIGQDCLELELGQSREELDKFKDKFRRLQNSYTASQRTNQELEDKLHTLVKKAEMDRKTLDWEIVELTNKLLDAKNTINKLEELNERYRLDCNLAVQLLKCNKSHFRNHKFADLPCELQDMVQKHLHSGQEAASPTSSVAPGAVVPTSVIARVLEKPESLLLNSAQAGSAGRPLAEDVFVHVDMSGDALGDPASPPAPGSPTPQPNGECTAGGSPEEDLPLPAFEKLSPYPTPSPPHPLYPGRKVIEFSEDKVRIPRHSPLPNCTYATRQAISLSLVEEGSERARPSPVPSSPASAQASPRHQPSPAPATLSAPASSASSEEDLLASWQRAFVDRTPPPAAVTQRTAFGRDTLPELQRHFALSSGDRVEVQAPSPPAESELLPATESGRSFLREEDEEELNLPASLEEECQSLLPSDGGTEEGPGTVHTEGRAWTLPSSSRPQRSPKRMGVHHLHRKDSLTQAQEQGNLLS
ncbi:PREDICTED: tight junction-associated protein 1 isoform X2 [Condylura cristata]|uniref:tight junction-associated protein 1 isoform X2 n=1 Tax=Condylura cristata TaxID=143302 RepID=UPI000643E0FB|nr:PREDICTED: tight junction-associated protein 1 isoform X2 [Condylura cristata]